MLAIVPGRGHKRKLCSMEGHPRLQFTVQPWFWLKLYNRQQHLCIARYRTYRCDFDGSPSRQKRLLQAHSGYGMWVCFNLGIPSKIAFSNMMVKQWKGGFFRHPHVFPWGTRCYIEDLARSTGSGWLSKQHASFNLAGTSGYIRAAGHKFHSRIKMLHVLMSVVPFVLPLTVQQVQCV
jgi:hypothetical protein